MNILFPEEKILRNVILPDLERGRPGWDRPHSEAVVYWMKELLQDSVLDPKVMIAAAYAHDWGYIDLFEEGCTYDRVQDQKERHMEVGAKRIGDLLRGQCRPGFSDAQIDRVMHLVFVHDKLSQLKEEDELMLMEADTMGALDSDLVKPTYSKEDNDKFVAEVKKKRRPLFVHTCAISNFDILLHRRMKFYEHQQHPKEGI